ncbi:MAG: hybrid sensor histidine kinase/response regulator [Verrucomicrobiota bacterium]|nr:hybrid sensor histidine kinase/response regulator [Limisphaera sp.]MDW8382990.1 hybrid sensor histidine kinase/response regulator [Verrucomicrobiota bacterium]
MNPPYDYRRYAILYVDDEEKSLRSFERAFADTFRILTATSAAEGHRLLQAHRDEIGLLMTDQRMPGEKGVWLLEQARQLDPRIIRVLVTAYSDYKEAIDAINLGAIYKYISKPWDLPKLEQTLKHALELFMVQRERDELLYEKMSVLRQVLMADRVVSLGLLAAGLSHHIRNALVAVKTFLDLAPLKLAEENVDLERLHDPGFWKVYHRNVQGQIDRINQLLQELWKASERPPGVFADRVRLAPLLREVCQQMAGELSARNLTVEHALPEDLPELTVDLPRFRRLFELLLQDELSSLPPGARVRFEARTLDEVDARRPHIEVRVTDNGPGLPEEWLRLVFDPFVCRSDSPAEFGIRLMACYIIVHHHGGTIHAKSEPGQGTTFVLRLPVQAGYPTETIHDTDFLRKALLNEELWHKLAASRMPG